ncbi:hypothetical protein BJ944DRAFT_274482 [Cunninghamella echinulata]|nr:hypothetical protein BJ944DRAFT_274482 [Cunninghamella echinulata]
METKKVVLYWTLFTIPFSLFFTVLSYRYDIFNLFQQRYPPHFEDQFFFLKLFKTALNIHRIASAIWCGTLCFQFFIVYFPVLKKNKKSTYSVHKWMGWIMVFSVISNILTGLILMYIKTRQGTKTQNYGLLSAAVYSFIAQCLLVISVVIYPKRGGHKQAAIRLMVAPFAAILQHLLYFFFIHYKLKDPSSSSFFFWDVSVTTSGLTAVISFEYYLWKKNYHF